MTRRRSARSSRPHARRSKLPERGGPLGPRDELVRRTRALLRDPKARRADQAFVVEGPRAVDAALDRDAPLTDVLLGPGAQRSFAPLVERIGARGIRVHELKEGVLERLGSTSTPQPVLAVASRAQPDVATLGGDGLVLVAVGLADPGNAGTMLRSAEAAGAAAIVLCRGSVDAYNPKVVRASAGAIFGIPVFEEWTAVEALDALGGLGRARLAARAHGGPRYDTLDFRAPTALVLGNEAHGLDPALDAHLDGTVSIPMAAPAESLNVAMAATVVCFEAARQRRAGGRP